MPAVSFVSIQCQLLSYETGLTSGKCPECPQNSHLRAGREIWMFPLLGGPRKIGSCDEDDACEMVGGRPGPHDGGVALAVYVIFIGIGSL